MTPSQIAQAAKQEMSPMAIAQTVLAGLILTALIWNSSTVSALDKKVSVMSARLQSATEDRYKGADAERDFALRDERIAGVRRDVDHNRGDLDELQGMAP